MLLDSNIIIYAAKAEHGELRQRLQKLDQIAVSAISVVEVLGFHRLTSDERKLFEEFFAAVVVLPISESVIDQAVRLRQCRKMTLGDALVAATALHYHHVILTRNTRDFSWISGLDVNDPLADDLQ